MAPYEPPSAHYAHLDVSGYDENMILCMVGKGGKGFYNLTNYLGLEYIWYDTNEKRIELWGPEHAFVNCARDKLIKSIDKFNGNFQKREIT